MSDVLAQWLSSLPRWNVTSVADILCVAILIYQLISLVRGRRAAHVLTGVAFIGLVYGVAIWAKLQLLQTILATLAPYTAIALIVMFQSELRRALARIGRRRLNLFSPIERKEGGDQIVHAHAYLSQNTLGTLIRVEQEIGMKSVVA